MLRAAKLGLRRQALDELKQALPATDADEEQPLTIQPPALLQWLRRAADLPGAAPARLAILLAQTAIRVQRTTYLDLDEPLRRRLAVSRTTAYTALVALEQAGLVEVDSGRGRRTTLVTILGWGDE